jgi:hypothetical protein
MTWLYCKTCKKPYGNAHLPIPQPCPRCGREDNSAMAATFAGGQLLLPTVIDGMPVPAGEGGTNEK